LPPPQERGVGRRSRDGLGYLAGGDQALSHLYG
jgi:hypothetical protein